MSNSIVEGYRLSPQQRRLWSLQDSDPASIYTAQCVVLIEGALDHELLTAAVAAVVRRREVLRTTIRVSPAMDIPVQSISPEIVASETRHSLRDAQPATQEKELAQLIESARSSANTNGDPPLRLSIVELAADRHVLILTLPAYCNDAAGMNQLVHQIGEHYRRPAHAEVRGGEEESLQYADLSEWQNDLLESPDTEAGRQRWQHLDLRDLLHVQLPWELPQSKAGPQGFSPKIAPVKLDAGLTARVVEIARSFGVSEAGFWLACWAVLLSRLTGTGELVIGTAFDGRHQPGLEDALGPLTKYLPLPVRIDHNLQFDQLLATVDQQLGEAREWQDYFSWDLVESNGNDGAEVSYCSVCFDFSSAGETENELPS